MHLSLLLYFLRLATVALCALEVDLDSPDSIRSAAKQVAYDLMTFYKGNQSGQVPGILPGPPPNGDYYWWQGGALWGTMLDYWHYTGDDTYNHVVNQSLLFQTGPDRDYMEPNWTASLGNDDQAFWGMSAMLAAEVKFPDPPKGLPQWLALAQAVWNEQASEDRRNSSLCGMGLRWQIYPQNPGYDYKNTIANAAFFNIGARLARYTENNTYATWCEDTWNWLFEYGIMVNNNNVYDVADGVHIWAKEMDGSLRLDCGQVGKAQFTYNAAALIQGAAFLYNYTNGNKTWAYRIEGLLNGIEQHFISNDTQSPRTLIEPACGDATATCTVDMRSFKGYTHRWLATTAQLAPFTAKRIRIILKSSTQAAVNQCTGGANGRMCGFQWASGTFTGPPGAGEQMNVVAALSSLLSLLDQGINAPVTNSTGGTSTGDPNAGVRKPLTQQPFSITVSDKVGAFIITAVLALGASVMLIWMSMDEGLINKRASYGLQESYDLEDMSRKRGILSRYR
ncbi:uncharacterized protein JN550_010363 [Neoarthrinium moseri]|uniref:uncharacterized protein n=1 Tax=Neoarthrinium moseri TaxID=1658444 RepID=UPI001FDDBDBA|nr:uncharacterized protein JN550_010363 [Neoarthrinium moseri]KAI1862207.1 hypothetical protein JN550_010363 [Neoarthrinium moseri]